jgi:hypothetical protein
VVELNQVMRRSIDTFGLSANALKIWELEQAGASAAALETARNLDAQMQVLERHKKLEEEAGQIRQQTLSPMQTFEAALARINQMEEEGLISAQDKALAIAKQTDELEKATHFETKGPSALTAGSREAFSAIHQFEMQSQRNDPQTRIENLAREANAQRAAVLAAAERTAEAVANFNVVAMN